MRDSTGLTPEGPEHRGDDIWQSTKHRRDKGVSRGGGSMCTAKPYQGIEGSRAKALVSRNHRVTEALNSTAPAVRSGDQKPATRGIQGYPRVRDNGWCIPVRFMYSLCTAEFMRLRCGQL